MASRTRCTWSSKGSPSSSMKWRFSARSMAAVKRLSFHFFLTDLSLTLRMSRSRAHVGAGQDQAGQFVAGQQCFIQLRLARDAEEG